jgi:hypothetical protein
MRYQPTESAGISFVRVGRFICRVDQIRAASLSLNSENKVIGVSVRYLDDTGHLLKVESEVEATDTINAIWLTLGGGVQ